MNDHWYMMADADPDRPMTPAQAAEWLQVEESTLRRWASDGGIPKAKLGAEVCFTLRLLRAWLAGTMVQGSHSGRIVDDGTAGAQWVLDGQVVRGGATQNVDVRVRGKRARSRGAAAVAATAQSRNFRDDTPIPFPELPNGTGDF